MIRYPGAQCVHQLLRLKKLMKKGDYVPPIPGMIRGKENFSFILMDSHDIVVEKPKDKYPLVSIRQGGQKFLVAVEEANELRIGSDGRGKPIFLSLNEEKEVSS